MTLNQFAAEERLKIFEDLLQGIDPSHGSFDGKMLREARAKGSPQMGTTTYSPSEIHFEFIYPDPTSAPTVLVVTLAAPERIVYMPVPTWVVENIWQGEIAGTHHFESEATKMMKELEGEISAEGNKKWFEPQAPKRRE